MWSVEVFETVSGQRLVELPVPEFSWSRTLRDSSVSEPGHGMSDVGVTGMVLTRGMLSEVMDVTRSGWQLRVRDLLMPVKHGVMFLWDGVPIVGGPISDTIRFTHDRVEVTVDSIANLLARRFAVTARFDPLTQLTFKNLSLGSIAARVVQAGMSRPAGGLPIRFLPERAGTHERNYQGFNVANLDVNKLLDEISDVVHGPDIDFRPQVDGQRFFWRMVTGESDTNPYIGQETVHDWEVGTVDTGELAVDLSAKVVAHRVFAVGDGQDAGTHVAAFDIPVPDGWPLVEVTATDSTVKAADDRDNARLRALAQARLNARPAVQAVLDVRADGAVPLGTFWPGEVAQVTVSEHLGLPDGTYAMRILEMSGDEGDWVKLTFDPLLIDAY